MATLALISTAILAICVFALLGAVLELHKDVRQMRKIVGVLDTPTTLDIGDAIGRHASSYGLPAAVENRWLALVIFLSESCSTCQVIASSLSDELPEGLWVVLSGRDANSAKRFHEQHFTSLSADSQQRVIVDFESKIFGSLGLETTPAGIRLKGGIIGKATTVPSVRYLESIIPKLVDNEAFDSLEKEKEGLQIWTKKTQLDHVVES